jgi:hypothetical protein
MTSGRKIMVVLALCLGHMVVGQSAPEHALASDQDGFELVEVYPTGDPGVDIAQVQFAVDSADEVILKASDRSSGVSTSFDFGANTPGGGFVVLGRDVVIRGETVGSHRTTITGGFAPFRGVASNPVTSSIRGIDFASPGVAALFVTGATGVGFVDNRVEDVLGLPDWVPGISKGQGVWIVGLETVTGEILIADNVIKGVDAQNGYGLALFGFSADARVENNTISGVNTAGILVGLHTGQVWVEDNDIAPGPQQAPEYGGGNGIIVGNARGGVAYVRNNTIDCENTWADGILVGASLTLGDLQDDAVIEHNRITMHHSLYGGIGLIGSVKNTLVANNVLDGAAAFAVYGLVWFTPSEMVETNTFIGNNISLFESSIADVAFDINTKDNLFIGRARTVIDLGADNWVSGSPKGRPPIPPGQRLNSRPGFSLEQEAVVAPNLMG